MTYNGPLGTVNTQGLNIGKGFRVHHKIMGPTRRTSATANTTGVNFGRLTKINMKSVEDEIEEEMSSGEDEIFN